MLAGNGCLPTTQGSKGDSRSDVDHERLWLVHRRLVSTLRNHDVLPIHDYYHGRVFRDLALLGRAQLGQDSGPPDMRPVPLQFALLFARTNGSAVDDWIGSTA